MDTNKNIFNYSNDIDIETIKKASIKRKLEQIEHHKQIIARLQMEIQSWDTLYKAGLIDKPTMTF